MLNAVREYGTDGAAALRRALRRSAAAQGCAVVVETTRETGWASGLYDGTRHVLTVRGMRTPVFDAWVAALPESDLPMAGRFVADLAVTARTDAAEGTLLTIEALTIEE